MHGFELGDADAATLRHHLRQGDFSALEPAFTSRDDGPPRVVQLLRQGGFAEAPEVLAEALTCAAFLGAAEVLETLLDAGVPPQGGHGTGLDALHWAANRGQLVMVQRLLDAGAALETQNRFGGTVLDLTVWSAIHEPRPAHLAIIERLLAAGANADAAMFPSGLDAVDAVLAPRRSR